MPDSSDIRREVRALARDRVSGATAVARRAARLLRAAARNHGKSLERWQLDLRAVGEAVMAAQPAMGSLVTVVDLALRATERARTPTVGTRAVGRAMEGYLRRQPAAAARAAARLARLLPPRATCLTISSSEVVYRALLAAGRRGRLAHVVVAESRPGCEGVGVARRLAASGVRVTLVVDALAAALVREVDAVVVGADAVTPAGVLNKSGTLALALAARAARRPLLVVATEDRLLRSELARKLRVPDAESRAVLPRPPRGIRVLNRLFDITPLRLITWVVSEAGAQRPRAVRDRLARRRLRRRRRDRRGPRAGNA